jgi:hypothetical protein
MVELMQGRTNQLRHGEKDLKKGKGPRDLPVDSDLIGGRQVRAGFRQRLS